MTAPDPSALLGTWTNADSATICLRQVRIEPGENGLTVQPLAAPGGADTAPNLPALGYLGADGTGTGRALAAEGRYGEHDIRLEGNLNAGLLVLCCYKYQGKPGRGGLFSREYFSRNSAPPQNTTDGAADNPLFHGIDPDAEPDTGTLLGDWRNAHSRSGVLEGLQIAGDGPDLDIRPRPRRGADWGAARAVPFTDVVYGFVSGAAARARFEAGGATVDMQVRQTKGVLVIAQYTRPADGAPPHFDRAFFHRA